MGQGLSNISNLWDQSRPPKSKFTVEDIPDLTGRVIIVTGSNTGVGKETVKVRLSPVIRLNLSPNQVVVSLSAGFIEQECKSLYGSSQSE